MKEPSLLAIDADRWQRISEIFFSVIETDPSQRDLALAQLCSGDSALSHEVQSLICAHENSGDFIQAPACIDQELLPEDDEKALPRAQRFGVFQAVREIGHGGMGAVYLAERGDGEYQHRVAIKVIRRGLDSEPNLRRFRSERQILAKLDHPNIARLLDGGTSSDGLPYLVMEYVDGQPIDRYCDQERLSIRERLYLFLKVCSAVQYAHEHGVVHRDLKPANILITTAGEPKLLDFGIAKLLGWDSPRQSRRTTTWLGPMTPDYASPEQVRGETVSTATDIYSLGALLYELMCGHRPYCLGGCLPHEMLRAICELEPEKPSFRVRSTDGSALTPEEIGALRSEDPDRLCRRLGGDLDNIVLMAMRKEPVKRYSSVSQFAEDTQRYLEGQPVAAREATVAYRAVKFIRRKQSLLLAVTVAVFILFSSIVIAEWRVRTAVARQVMLARRPNESRKPEPVTQPPSPGLGIPTKVVNKQDDPKQLRKGLLQQLSRILEAHDSARGLVVNTSALSFDPGNVTLRPDARERLAKIAGVLAVYPSLTLQVEGHTDNAGDDSLNLQVSRDRARAVKDYLMQQAIPEKMMTAEGFGGSRPIVSNDTIAGRQRNRRVEIIISGDMTKRGNRTISARRLKSASMITRTVASVESASDESSNPDLALNKPAKGSPACNSSEGPEKAFNGSVSGGHGDKWCSHASPAFLQVDLGGVFPLRQFVVKHAGAGGDPAVLNTRDFIIQVSDDGSNFTTVTSVVGNMQNVTTHVISPAVAARFVRLNISNPSRGDNSSRIYELEVYSLAQVERRPE